MANTLTRLRRFWKYYLAAFQPPLPASTAQERQGQRLGLLLAIILPLATLNFVASVLTRHPWSLIVGPLLMGFVATSSLNRRSAIRISTWLFVVLLMVASLATEFTQIPGGPTPIVFAFFTVCVSGFLIGRWKPFPIAALIAACDAAHLHVMMQHHQIPMLPMSGEFKAGVPADGVATPSWFPLVPLLVLPVAALVSSLLSGSLEEARRRADELARVNAALGTANARLEALATADPLTGLLNHRGMVTSLDAELERARRYERPCALLFLDIDHFKALNDGYGHAAGDVILQEFAQILCRSLRGVDVVSRWGGEEFVILLPEMDSLSAEAAGERVRAGVAGFLFPVAGGLRLTCSVGMAAFPEDAADRPQLLEAADQAMYAAKRLGRNQVRRADDPAVALMRMETVAGSSREEATVLGTVEALASLVAARDNSTGKHSQEVAALALRLATELGLDPAEARMVSLAGRLHDIGTVGVPDVLLHKAGRLSEDEWAVVRRHPLLGAEVVGYAPMLRALAPLIRGHHERWDGTGYPDGLAGNAVPLGARVLAVADSYLTLTSDLTYCGGEEQSSALDQIACMAGTQFDPRVVDALLEMFPSNRPKVLCAA